MAEFLASRVWMVSALTGPEGVEGTLVLEAARLVFLPADGAGPTEIALADVRRVHRMLGTPVLEIRRRTGSPPVLGFYFVEPPSLERGEGRFARPRTARRRAAVQLMVANPAMKEQIKAWVQAIRHRGRDRRAGTSEGS